MSNGYATSGMRQAPAATLDRGVVGQLRSVATRLRTFVLVEGVARIAVFLLIAGAVQFLFDWGTRGVRWSIRAALLGVILVTVCILAWRHVIAPLLVRIDVADVAKLIERKFPQLGSLLISAVRFSRGEVGDESTNARAFVNATVSRAASATRGLEFSSVVDSRRARWASLVSIAIVASWVVAALAAPEMTGLWFSRNVLLRNDPWPKQTELVVELKDGELIGARGDDLVIQAYARGVEPREVELYYETSSGERGRQTMVTVGSRGAYRYRYTFKNAQEDFTFYLRGGDDTTDVFNARLMDRPRVASATIRIVPPAYSKLAPFTLADGQRAGEALPGCQATFSIQTTKPVVRAALVAGTEEVAEASGGGTSFVVSVTPTETQTYTFNLLDEVGLANRQPVRFALRIVKDEPPRVRLKVDSAGEMITPQAVLPMELEFADTYGLATADLVFDVSRDTSRQGLIPLDDFAPELTSYSTSLTWAVDSESVEPGDRLTLFAEAQDFDNVLGPNAAESQRLAFRIVTAEELLAELARREQEVRMDFERLVDAQEQLRGRILSLVGPSAPLADTSEFSTAAAALERRQRNLAGSVNVVRQQVEQILNEFRINKLSDDTIEERLGEMIVDPLSELVRRDFPRAADAIRAWSRSGSAESAANVDPPQVALLSQMRAVLANMIQWEGYQEAVTMLRDILRLQAELRNETEGAAEQDVGDLFDDKKKE